MEWLKKVGSREMVRVVCPHCDHLLNLEDDETKIKVDIKFPEGEGALLLSAFWGDYRVSEEGPDRSVVVTMHCPHCKKSLQGTEECSECSATTSILKFSSGAIAICNRKGCKMHLRSSTAKIMLTDMLTLSVSAWGGPYDRL